MKLGEPVFSLAPHLPFYFTGLTHIITMDLHQKEIQGFFTFPVDNLRASPFLIQYIQEEVIVLFMLFISSCLSKLLCKLHKRWSLQFCFHTYLHMRPHTQTNDSRSPSPKCTDQIICDRLTHKTKLFLTIAHTRERPAPLESSLIMKENTLFKQYE